MFKRFPEDCRDDNPRLKNEGSEGRANFKGKVTRNQSN